MDTRQWVIKLFALTTALICSGIAGVLIVRVAIDGNAPLTEQITAGFVNQLPQLLGFLAAVIVGEPIVSGILAKLAGVPGVSGATVTVTPTNMSIGSVPGSIPNGADSSRGVQPAPPAAQATNSLSGG